MRRVSLRFVPVVGPAVMLIAAFVAGCAPAVNAPSVGDDDRVGDLPHDETEADGDARPADVETDEIDFDEGVTDGGADGADDTEPGCVCAGTNACCDGCFAVNDAEACDDENAATPVDLCASGRCIGGRESGRLGRFVYVAAGSYDQGCSPGDRSCRDNELPVRRVTVTRGFWMKETEVTQGEWRALSGGVNPACFQSASGGECSDAGENDDGPVEAVDLYSTAAYANAQSAREGLTPCYMLAGCADPTTGWVDGAHSGCVGVTFVGLGNCTGYRLPTEAEWEYAARAGTTTATYGGDPLRDTGCATLTGAGDVAAGTALSDLGWYGCNAGRRTQPVRKKSANPWGLYDMLGNVLEWTWDAYTAGAYAGGAAVDPAVDGRPNAPRAVRGGAWFAEVRFMRASARDSLSPDDRNQGLGFRLVRSQ